MWKRRTQEEIQEVRDEPRSHEQGMTPWKLGNAGWTILHSFAAAYPKQPTEEQRSSFSTFLKSWSVLYPCDYCAEDMRTWMADHPPELESRESASKWVCRMHNDVNEKLGKHSPFDCNDVAALLRTWGDPSELDVVDTSALDDWKKKNCSFWCPREERIRRGHE
eukprot:TRINITY_DN24491_c0_g1_i1.p1 TRINITY_DN24491_c0_g1~~TRINITY_DN24491_c0_g1_i1.p1  ORF type:complete len:164 (-),score=14.89 TRINITY_DN24491_c0_g1_i1:172-663(-)